MTKPYESQAPHPGPASTTRPGRKLGPITENVGSAHRAWLEPMRDSYLKSGLTMSELSGRVRFAKSKISELLRGAGLYPRWEMLQSVSIELRIPQGPLQRLWRQGAFEGQKSKEWVERSSGKTALTMSPPVPPLDHRAFRELMETQYTLYAQVFLNDDQRDAVVSDVFDILWLRWNEALSSPALRLYAWRVLRTNVMSRTPHIDGRPSFATAAFDTVALQSLAEADHDARAAQIEETLELFKAMSRLPDHQLDVMVLRHLCGMPPEEASDLLGVPVATVRSDERHALHFLESVMCPPPETEGNTL
ncbi:sigma-70 family RNA polymerase sigma factor [Streptomyces sp. NPDC059101]|uniref:sigma-70 family RNA polymerase sigma factor n=1 Tax=Streptomyces sp. NPDC059101 TaxID=3346728 RepID=UPI0036C0E730